MSAFPDIDKDALVFAVRRMGTMVNPEVASHHFSAFSCQEVEALLAPLELVGFGDTAKEIRSIHRETDEKGELHVEQFTDEGNRIYLFGLDAVPGVLKTKAAPGPTWNGFATPNPTPTEMREYLTEARAEVNTARAHEGMSLAIQALAERYPLMGEQDKPTMGVTGFTWWQA